MRGGRGAYWSGSGMLVYSCVKRAKGRGSEVRRGEVRCLDCKKNEVLFIQKTQKVRRLLISC